jgi:hypothetical protein
VAWQDARHGGWDIYLNMSADFGKTWRPEGMRLNTGAPGEAQQDEIYLTWSTDLGKTWLNADIRVDDQPSGEAAIKPQIAMLQDGAAVIAWEVTRQDRQEIAVKVLAPSVRQTSAR